MSSISLKAEGQKYRDCILLISSCTCSSYLIVILERPLHYPVKESRSRYILTNGVQWEGHLLRFTLPLDLWSIRKLTMHKFHVKLSCPENIKELPSMVSEYWTRFGWMDGQTDGGDNDNTPTDKYLAEG